MSDQQDVSTELVNRYTHIKAWLEEQGLGLYAGRIEEIIQGETAGSQRMTVALSGLFSAGKSSLINALADGQLATGAVPTTADVASILLPGTDGRVQLLDTPGVDSTDESHRAATMNALYRADVMVLVADYQHVEAEENLELLRTFSEDGKRILFVVNQIDKHLEFELPFEEFRRHVEEALEDYGIEVEGLFFTSTTASVHNEINDLREWLFNLGQTDDSTRLDHVKRRLMEVVREAVTTRYADDATRFSKEVEAQFAALPIDLEEAKLWLNNVEVDSERISKGLEGEYATIEEEEEKVRQEWVRSVELAQIAPYETTEKGRYFVESLRADFKVGFIGAAKKTAEERNRRADAFIADLAQHVNNFLVVPLRNQMTADIQEYGWGQVAWLNDLKQIEVIIDLEYVKSQVKEGALGSSQYPYQFVKDVVSKVRRQVLGAITTLTTSWFKQVRDSFNEAHQADEQKLAQLKSQMDCLQNYIGLHERQEKEIEQLLEGEVPSV